MPRPSIPWMIWTRKRQRRFASSTPPPSRSPIRWSWYIPDPQRRPPPRTMQNNPAILVVCMLILPVLASMPAQAQRRTITLPSLLKEMTDRDAMARWPSPEYTERQASSYDRRSKTPADPEGWFANDDFSQFIRSEENTGRWEWVMMEAEGPGCVVRIWFGGMLPKGILRFYLDGAETPAIEGPAYEALVGKLLAERPLAIENAHGIPGAPGGMNLFLPIPYSRHCKITYEEPGQHDPNKPPEGRWYNIEYRTYAPGTRVRTFTIQDWQVARLAMEKTCQTLLDPPVPPAGREITLDRTLAPGESATVDFPKGPAAVRWLQAQVVTEHPEDLDQALRSTVLRIGFDGEETIWCPLGDFFGSGVGLNALESWYRTITRDGLMTCRWVMPYASSAALTLQNLGKQPVTVRLKAR